MWVLIDVFTYFTFTNEYLDRQNWACIIDNHLGNVEVAPLSGSKDKQHGGAASPILIDTMISWPTLKYKSKYDRERKHQKDRIATTILLLG